MELSGTENEKSFFASVITIYLIAYKVAFDILITLLSNLEHSSHFNPLSLILKCDMSSFVLHVVHPKILGVKPY